MGGGCGVGGGRVGRVSLINYLAAFNQFVFPVKANERERRGKRERRERRERSKRGSSPISPASPPLSGRRGFSGIEAGSD